MTDTEVVIAPQPGPQTVFCSSTADIAIYGGHAGGGKSVALLLDPLRFVDRPGFGGVIFRHTHPEIVNEGGLWDTSEKFYFDAGAIPKQSSTEWYWPHSGVTIAFSHMQHEKHRLSWQGAAIPYIGFDELTHFSRSKFFYMLSRNRLSKPCGVKPYVRATCNPDPDSWVAEFIAWWIDQDTGYPIPERSGVLRWFYRKGDSVEWFDTREEAMAYAVSDGIDAAKAEVYVKSVTFIEARLEDNKILMEMDPNYEANLNAMAMVDRMRLRSGNWKFRPIAGTFFQRGWFKLVDAAPVGGRTVRYWDRAATEAHAGNTDPDWTVGLKLNRSESGRFTIVDVVRLRGRPDLVQRTIRMTAEMDGDECEQWLEVDPGQAGIVEKQVYVGLLEGLIVRFKAVRDNKLTRAKPASAQSEAGNVDVVRAPWNEALFSELESFADWENIETPPEKLPHDDQVDAFSGGMGVLYSGGPQVRSINGKSKSQSVKQTERADVRSALMKEAAV